jgi:hypothetical protein
MTKQKIMKIVCGDCGGTGLYEGMCEEKGYPVVCCGCMGTGCIDYQYEPFKKRKIKRGIKGVSLSRGRFIITGVGPVGKTVSYKDFLKGKLEYHK